MICVSRARVRVPKLTWRNRELGAEIAADENAVQEGGFLAAHSMEVLFEMRKSSALANWGLVVNRPDALLRESSNGTSRSVTAFFPACRLYSCP
jgi:hypothetical protein